ncbi:hypothetical protein PsgRace4_03432, partial [Pseudomonas savastanoi pv. glycinea str. race 4]
ERIDGGQSEFDHREIHTPDCRYQYSQHYVQWFHGLFALVKVVVRDAAAQRDDVLATGFPLFHAIR